MAWLVLTNAKVAAPIGMRIDVGRTVVSVVVDVIDGDGRREVAA
jgi:predicted Kef-type K+ transport protein